MTEDSAKFEVHTKIASLTDREGNAYSIGGVQVTPAQNGKVFLCATDTRGLAITSEIGSASRGMIVPAKPIERSARKNTVSIEINGQLTIKKMGRRGPVGEPDVSEFSDVKGRFPRVEDFLPKIGKGWRAIRLNPAVLAKIQEAMSIDDGSFPCVTILIPPADRDDSGCVKPGCIPLVSGDSIGCIQSLDVDHSADEIAKRFNATAQAYRDAREAAISARSAE